MKETETDAAVKYYKRNVRKILRESVGQTQADILMDTYKDDFEEFIKMKWSPATAAMAILMGY